VCLNVRKREKCVFCDWEKYHRFGFEGNRSMDSARLVAVGVEDVIYRKEELKLEGIQRVDSNKFGRKFYFQIVLN